MWLSEFGVLRSDGILPSFAFSMMPKMQTLMDPSSLGTSFPFFMMGKTMDIRIEMGDIVSLTTPNGVSNAMNLFGQGVHYAVTYYAHGWYTMYLACGVYLILYALFPVMAVG